MTKPRQNRTAHAAAKHLSKQPGRLSRALCAAALAFSFLAPGALNAKDAEPPAALPDDFSAYTPVLTPPRLEQTPPPKIDGKLDDAAWARAATTENFYQIEPEDGAAPSERTRAYILYDDKTLYVAIYAYDSEPDKIRRSLMERDPPIRDDDGLRLIIDSFGTFKDGYFFAVNPNGARLDALTQNNNSFSNQWNTIWRAKTQIVEDGWTAEFAIPFQSISFDPNLDDWGFQIIRTIRRKNEEIRWSNISRSRGRIDLTNPGRLRGIKDVQSGAGLEAQVFVKGALSRDHQVQETDASIDPSANIFYKITPSLTGSLTFNTDFADTAPDARQVNTGRFSLFFPETRDFFLQDRASFEFGGEIFNNSRNGLPFFTRNIGIVDGAPVDIVAGAKISGKAGPLNIGAISTRTASSGDIDGQTLSAVRISKSVLQESKFGVIATHGDPSGETDNTALGADFQYRNSRLIGDGQVMVDAIYLNTQDDGEGGSYAGLRASYEGDRWDNFIGFAHYDADYAPRLGFTNRTGIREYKSRIRRRWRPENAFLRTINLGHFTEFVTDLDNTLLDRNNEVFFEVQTDAADEGFVAVNNYFTRIDQSFDIAGELTVPAGSYHYTDYTLGFETSGDRPIALASEIVWGEVFDGDIVEISTEIAFRPTRFFRLDFEHELTKFTLPTGDLSIHVAALESTIAFTPDMTLKTELQYDNISESFTAFSRFSWEPVPEREIFLSFGHVAEIERNRFPRDYRSTASSLALRLGHTFRL